MNIIDKKRTLAALEAQQHRERIARQSALNQYIFALESDSAEMRAALRTVSAARTFIATFFIIVALIKLTEWGML